MSPFAHGLSASLVAVTFAQVAPEETHYIAAAVIAATVVDLDHLVHLVRNHVDCRNYPLAGRWHDARSPLHELLGLMLAGVLCAFVFAADPKLAQVMFVAFTVHLSQDWLLGKSYPLTPFSKTCITFFELTFRQKVIVDITVILISGALWTRYLNAQ